MHSESLWIKASANFLHVKKTTTVEVTRKKKMVVPYHDTLVYYIIKHKPYSSE